MLQVKFNRSRKCFQNSKTIRKWIDIYWILRILALSFGKILACGKSSFIYNENIHRGVTKTLAKDAVSAEYETIEGNIQSALEKLKPINPVKVYVSSR